VTNQDVHEVFVGHRGCDLVFHVGRFLEAHLVELLSRDLHLEVGSRRVLLNSRVRAIAEPDV